MIRLLQTIFLLLACSLLSHAQVLTLPGFSNFKTRAFTPLYAGGEVKAYALFYKGDMADRRNANFGLDLYDQNLQKLKTITIPRDANFTHLMRASFNGSALALYYYTALGTNVELELYDKALNKVGVKKISLTNVNQDAAAKEFYSYGNGQNKTIGGMNLYAVPDKGFIRNEYTSRQKGFLLEMYDNNLELKWTYQTDKKSKGFETMLVKEVTGSYFLTTIARRPSKSSKKLTFHLAAFDVETGKKVLDMPIEKDKSEHLSLSTFTFDSKKNEFVAIGEFYNLKDKVAIDKSKGFFVKRIGLDGSEKSARFFTWDKDINPLLPREAKKSLEAKYRNFLHDVVQGADGNLYVISEQYRIKKDVGATIFFGIGDNPSNHTGVTGNLMLYTLNQDLSLAHVHFIEKDRFKSPLIPYLSKYNAGLRDHVVKMTGGLNYQFTLADNDGKSFQTAYVNIKDIKGSRYDESTIANIMYPGKQDPATDILKLTFNKKTASYVYPAKPGYVLVLENHVEDKRIEMRLVKLNK